MAGCIQHLLPGLAQPHRTVGPEVLGVEGSTVGVRGLEMREGTPVLDIKPYADGSAPGLWPESGVGYHLAK
jgi:hypothetical protein